MASEREHVGHEPRLWWVGCIVHGSRGQRLVDSRHADEPSLGIGDGQFFLDRPVGGGRQRSVDYFPSFSLHRVAVFSVMFGRSVPACAFLWLLVVVCIALGRSQRTRLICLALPHMSLFSFD